MGSGGEKVIGRLRAFCVGLSIAAPVLVALAIVALWVMPGESYFTEGGKDYLRQNQLIETSIDLGFRAVVACVVVGVVCGVARIKQAWWCLVGACVGPIALFFAALGHLGAYVEAGKPVRKEANDYVLLSSHFMQGSDLRIARRLGGPPWAVVYEKLASAPWEDSDGFVPVVRPAGTRRELGLLCSPKGFLVQVTESGHCYVAYDLRGGKEYTQSPDHEKTRSYIDAVSPFVLLGETDRPDPADEASLLKGEQFARPRSDVVKRDLESKNPEVRRLAQAVLDRHFDKHEDSKGN